MRQFDFDKPFTYLTAIIMLGVKAFIVIVFVFLVLIAGVKNQDLASLINPEVTTPSDNASIMTTPSTNAIQGMNTPVPDIAYGLREMVVPTAVPETVTPSFTETAIMLPTNTSDPTITPTNTEAPTFTPTNTATSLATSTSTAVLTSTVQSIITASPSLTPTTRPTITKLASSTPTAQATATPSVNSLLGFIQSPLQGISVSELPGIISQNFELPPTGADSGHHGVDFAFWKRGDLSSIEGVNILSIFPGKVASASSSLKFPYGYMVMVETPLKNLPQEVIDAIVLPEASSTATGNQLTCPLGFADWWSTTEKSLYVLYGHMENPPNVTLKQEVKMGDVLGQVGNTGDSSSPHLHLEMRVGPSNATFSSMGHYVDATSDQERHNYCMWRVSGEFQMFDPMILLAGSEN